MLDRADNRAVVAVGAGQAAHQLAVSLRNEGWTGKILLVGDEPHAPYQRPPISKSHAFGNDAADVLMLGSTAFYAGNEIEFISSCSVTGIDRNRNRKQITTSTRGAFPYNHLVLATGARNRRLAAVDHTLTNVFSLRGIADVEALREQLRLSRRIVVIGGGFLGLEFAMAALTPDRKVSVIEAMPTLLSRALRPVLSTTLLHAHRSAGLDIRLGTHVTGIRTVNGRANGVRLATGETLEADLVLVSIGVQANDALASAAGLSTDNGVVVDRRLLTQDPAISAIGDCASFPSPEGTHMRLESVQNAIDQARYVARRIVHASDDGYADVPWFWSQQGATRIHVAGITSGSDHTLMRGDGMKIAALCFRDGRFVGVEALNAFADYRAGRTILEKRASLDVATAEKPDFDLRLFASRL